MEPANKPRAPRLEIEIEAVEHAARHWEAETETARRLAGRSNAILALIVAVLGYGVWNLGALEAIHPHALRGAIRGFLGLSLALLLSALVLLLVPPHSKRGDRLASSWMSLDPAEIPVHLTRAAYLALARRSIERSASALEEQNAQGQKRANEAQTLLLSAALCAGTAVLCYLCLSA